MDWLVNLVSDHGKSFDSGWSSWTIFWNAVGWLGQAVFFSRFYVQWYATERKKEVVVPVLFWWLSLTGSVLLLLYAAFYDKHYVVIFGYSFAWIPYIRNLIIHQRHKQAHTICQTCANACSPQSNFCSACGSKLAGSKAGVA